MEGQWRKEVNIDTQQSKSEKKESVDSEKKKRRRIDGRSRYPIEFNMIVVNRLEGLVLIVNPGSRLGRGETLT